VALKLGETGLLEAAQKKYREWRLKNPKQPEIPEPDVVAADEADKQEEIVADDIEQSAYEANRKLLGQEDTV